MDSLHSSFRRKFFSPRSIVSLSLSISFKLLELVTLLSVIQDCREKTVNIKHVFHFLSCNKLILLSVFWFNHMVSCYRPIVQKNLRILDKTVEPRMNRKWKEVDFLIILNSMKINQLFLKHTKASSPIRRLVKMQTFFFRKKEERKKEKKESYNIQR